MPTFLYTAKSFNGETKTGVASAKDIHQLSQILKRDDLVLIEAVLEGEKNRAGFRIPLPFSRVSATEKIMMARNLQIMTAAGLPLVRSLVILSNQSKSPKFKKALLDIKEEVSKGKSFSDALSKYPDIFSELFISMVKVGEESGTLEEVFKTLSLQMEKERDLKSKVKGAMIYPAIIILAMIGVGILMMIMVVPKLGETFKELNVELPLATKIIISISTTLATSWYLVILGAVFLVIASWFGAKTKGGKKLIDMVSMRTPIISPIIKKTNSASIIRNLTSLISSGVPMVRSLEIISNTLGNFYYKNAISLAAVNVKKGERLSGILKPYSKIFPFGVVEMIEVGEETGETTEILNKLADFFEEEVNNATKNLVSVIEPVLMLVIGAAVGFFAVSMIQPMYSMLGAM